MQRTLKTYIHELVRLWHEDQQFRADPHSHSHMLFKEMPNVTFLQYFVLFFDENTAGYRKILFFSKYITTHVYCTTDENTVFHPKYFFSALKILQTILQGWHPNT